MRLTTNLTAMIFLLLIGAASFSRFRTLFTRPAAPKDITIDLYRGVVPFVAIQLIKRSALWMFPLVATLAVL